MRQILSSLNFKGNPSSSTSPLQMLRFSIWKTKTKTRNTPLVKKPTSFNITIQMYLFIQLLPPKSPYADERTGFKISALLLQNKRKTALTIVLFIDPEVSFNLATVL